MQEPDSERAPVLEMPRRSPEPAPAPSAARLSVGDMPRWQMILTFVLAALLAMAVAVAVHSERRARAIETRLEESMSEVQAGLPPVKPKMIRCKSSQHGPHAKVDPACGP